MAVHQPHLLDFSNAVMAMEEAPPPSFDHGLLAGLHVDGADTPAALHHRVHADDDMDSPWPQQAVSLSLYNYNTAPPGGLSSSLVGHHDQQPTPAAVSVGPNGQLLLPMSSSSMQLQAFQLIRSSRYLGPVKELLAEFCSVEEDLLLHAAMNNNKRAPKAAGNWDVDVEALSSGIWGSPSVSSMDLLELGRRKARLLSMVQEVDRRYRRYREQMRAVAASFEAVAGAGAAQAYTRLALRAMSRHFRCLRDALVAQVRALRKAMGESDGCGAAPAGATKGDTPRLRALDQSLRQQRSFQQHPGAMENCPWRPQRGLPERAVAVLRAWLFEHFLHPYPNDVDKHILARQTGLSRSQVSNWFINARVRLWKPMIEEMYTEEMKQQSEANQKPSGTAIKHEKNTTTSATTLGGVEESYLPRAVGNPNSMISSSTVTEGDHLFHSYRNMMHGSHNAVSLTLGLQQQPFTPSMRHQGSLMLAREEEETVLPYRNLMGSQLLHDLAGSL